MTEHSSIYPMLINFDEELYANLDEAITTCHGVSFEAFAAERPADAYDLLSRIIEETAKVAEQITSNGMRVSSKMDGAEATSAFGEYVAKELKVDTDIEPIEVILSVLGKPKLWDAIRGRQRPPVKVVSFRVDPPSLAF